MSEISKRTSFWGGLIASLPLTSILAIVWLYIDTNDKLKVANLSTNIFWFVIPSLLFFVFFPIFLKMNINFYISMLLSSSITMFGYWIKYHSIEIRYKNIIIRKIIMKKIILSNVTPFYNFLSFITFKVKKIKIMNNSKILH